MKDLVLSNDLAVITAEINAYKQVAGEAIFEIGRRLKHVKENDLTHGNFGKWLRENVEMTWQTANKFMRAYEEFGNYATSRNLGTAKIFELIALPSYVDKQEFIEKPHVIPSTGELKTVDEMTVRELREVKKALKAAEQAKKEAEQKAQEAESRLALALSQSEKEIEELKRQLERAREEVRIKEVIKEVPSQELIDKVSELERQLREQAARQRQLQEELRQKDDELLALTREEIRMKERHLIYENVSYMARDVKKWMGKLRLDIHKRAHIEGDEEVRRTLDACIAVLQEAIDEMKSWNDNLTKRGVIDAEYTVVAGSS